MGGPARRTSCLVAESPGFTGLGTPSFPGFPVSPPPGQCINSQPWLRALTHCVAPPMRGRPGSRRRQARATGLLPVGPPWAGAEAAEPRGCSVALCATTALAGAVSCPCVRGARGWFGGFGPVPGVVSLSFPPSRPACPALLVAGRPVRLSLTLARWYAIPRGLCIPRARSGCPSGSPRVPFACVCARAPAASAPPPPSVVWRAHLARSRHWALVGPFHVVCTPPRVLPRSLAPSGVLWGGGSPVPVPPYLAWGCGGGGRASPGGVPSTVARGVWGQALPLPRLPAHWAGCWGPLSTCCGRGRACGGPSLSPWSARPVGAARRGAGPWRSCAGGRARGGGRAPCPPLCGRGGACRAGGRSALFRPSAFPGQATKRVSLASFCPWGAWPPIPLRFVLARLHWARSVRRPGAGSLVLRGSCGSWRLGRGGGSRSGSSLGRGGGGGGHPPCLGGRGPGPPRFAGRWGGWAGGVGPFA